MKPVNAVQYDLFAQTLDERFDAWLAGVQGRAIYEAARARALALRARGFPRYGIKAILEAIRFDNAVARGPGEEYLVNNNYASRLARRLMADHKELAGFFETRELLSRTAPAPTRAVVIPIGVRK